MLLFRLQITKVPRSLATASAAIVLTAGCSGTDSRPVSTPTAPTVALSDAAISSISPDYGITSGGARVTITGSGFLPGATVTIGGAATNVSVVNSSTITATTSAYTGTLRFPTGVTPYWSEVDVVVASPSARVATLTNGFAYTVPSGVSIMADGESESSVGHVGAVVLPVGMTSRLSTILAGSARGRDYLFPGPWPTAWETDSPGVASVDGSGVVRAVGSGTARITATVTGVSIRFPSGVRGVSTGVRSVYDGTWIGSTSSSGTNVRYGQASMDITFGGVVYFGIGLTLGLSNGGTCTTTVGFATNTPIVNAGFSARNGPVSGNGMLVTGTLTPTQATGTFSDFSVSGSDPTLCGTNVGGSLNIRGGTFTLIKR